MANASAKKIVRQNAHKLLNLRSYAITINFLYILLKFLFFKKSTDQGLFTWTEGLIFSIVNIVFLSCFAYLNRVASPSFDSQGNILNAGEELNGQNLTAYVFDVIYIGWFATLGSLISSYFWYIYIVVPVFAGYKIFTVGSKFLAPFTKSLASDTSTQVATNHSGKNKIK